MQRSAAHMSATQRAWLQVPKGSTPASLQSAGRVQRARVGTLVSKDTQRMMHFFHLHFLWTLILTPTIRKLRLCTFCPIAQAENKIHAHKRPHSY